MQLRTVLLALGAGIATTLLVGAAFTEALAPAIALSTLVGLPIGIAAGLVAGAAVLVLVSGRDTEPIHRHAATAVGVCGLALLSVFSIAVFGAGVGATIGLLVAVVAGVLVGVAVFVWLASNDSRNVHAVTSR